ncbi:MAG: preprotein translocase subunit SecG [Proteobacteria bacterium]|nr:preprotein translocase subunit SecG [Pseudomonadota bacterium]
MQLIVLSIHLVVCIALIGLVLLQRSEGGALGMGGGGSGALMSGRGAADALAKMTQVAGFFFLLTSLSLTVLSGAASTEGRSVFDIVPRNAPISLPATPAPVQPAPAQPAHPDPTQSSAPQAAQSQLAAALLPGPSAASAATPQTTPASTNLGERAAPLQVRPPATQQQHVASPLPTAPPLRTATTPASVGATAHPAATSAAATHRSGSATSPSSTQPRLILPTSPGAQALADGQTAPESSDAGVQPVRRQRAGPDQ